MAKHCRMISCPDARAHGAIANPEPDGSGALIIEKFIPFSE
jgi:hypothetical protein